MNWKATQTRTGKTVILTDKEKEVYEHHPATRGFYSFERIQETVKEPIMSLEEDKPKRGRKKNPKNQN